MPSYNISLFGAINLLVFAFISWFNTSYLHFISIPLWLYLKIMANESNKENIIYMISSAN